MIKTLEQFERSKAIQKRISELKLEISIAKREYEAIKTVKENEVKSLQGSCSHPFVTKYNGEEDYYECNICGAQVFSIEDKDEGLQAS